MKKYLFVPLVITLLFSVSVAFGGVKKSVNKNAIVDNLHAGLISDNYGLKVSSALVLGQLISNSTIEADDASKTIIPLLRIMNSEENDEARIVAALALYKLNSERGISLLRYAAEKDNSERFSRIGATFYNAYYQETLGE